MRRTCIVLTAIAIAGCNGSLSRSDGGTGAGGSGGAGGTAAGGSGGSSAADGSVDGLSADFRTQLDEAAVHWAATKTAACSTYSYDRRTTSFTGYTTSTEVEIQNDVPTRRRFSTGSTRVDGGGWTVVADETGSQIGQDGGQYLPFPPLTIEQLLADCATILAHDPADYLLTIQISTSGVPWACTNFPRNCADDCESGIRIQSFACTPLPATHP